MKTKWNFLLVLALLSMLSGWNVEPARAETFSVGDVHVLDYFTYPNVEVTSSIVGTELHASAAVPGYYEGLTCDVDFGDSKGNANIQEEGWWLTDPRSCAARSHYTTAGTFTITITVTDPVEGTSISKTTTHEVTYTDVAFYDAPIMFTDPLFTKLLEPSLVNEAVIAFALVKDGKSYYSAQSCTVDYGDGGGPEAGTLAGWPASCIGLKHTYTTPGTYTIIMTLNGYNGSIATLYGSHQVTVEADPYQTAGFTAPLDLSGVLNTAKAGQMIPLKWRLLDGSGLPVTDLTSSDLTLTVSPYACPSGDVMDAIEAYATGTTELQNLGDGYYQLNWKTDKAWANSCKQLTLKIGTWTGDGLTALFQFKK